MAVDKLAWKRRLEGAFFPAVPVPFRSDGTLDAAAQESYVRYMAGQAPTGVAVWAHTGRGLYLTREQRRLVLQSWRAGLGEDALIVAGCGGPDVLRMAEDAVSWGADLLMVYPPVAFRGSPGQDEQILAYHRALDGLGKPLLLFYLYEEAGGIRYSLELLSALLDLPNVVGIKMATLSDVCVYQDVAARIAVRFPDVVLVTGEDRFLGYSLMAGARAALVGMGAACPGFQHGLVRAWLAGDYDRFVPLSQKADTFAQATFIEPMEGYIRRMLHALVLLGVIPAEAAHDPWGPPLPGAQLQNVEAVMRRIGEL